MGETLRHRIQNLYANYQKRDLQQVLAEFDEQAVFTSFAPIDVFPFLGRKIGKAAIAEALTAIGAQYELLSYVPTFLVVEGEQAAALVAARFRQRATDRIIQVTLAHFLSFSGGRIAEFREYMDTFDAVEQVIGHEIAVNA